MINVRIFFLTLVFPITLVAQQVDFAEVSFERGMDKYLTHENDSAKVYFKYALNSNPNHLKALFYLGKMEYKVLNYKEALKIFNDLQHRNWSATHYSKDFWDMAKRTMAHAYYMSHLNKKNEDHLKEALVIINMAISTSKCSAESYYLKSLICTEMKKKGPAKSTLKKAISVNPYIDMAYVKLARLEKSKVKSIFYLKLGAEFNSENSMSQKKFDLETANTDVEYQEYIDKKLAKKKASLLKKSAKKQERCGWAKS